VGFDVLVGRDLSAHLDVDCFVLNTGRVGPVDVGVEETVALLRHITRESLRWVTDDTTGLTLPRAVPGMDTDEFDVATVLPDPVSTLEDLRDERQQYLDQFDALDQSITDARY